MLRLNIKKEQFPKQYENINVAGAVVDRNVTPSIIRFTCSEPHNLIDGDTVRCSRIANGYTIRDNYEVKVIDNTTFSIDEPQDYQLNVTEVDYMDYNVGFDYRDESSKNNRCADSASPCWDDIRYDLRPDGRTWVTLEMSDKFDSEYKYAFPESMEDGMFGSGGTVTVVVMSGDTIESNNTYDINNYPQGAGHSVTVAAGRKISFTYEMGRPFKVYGKYRGWSYRVADTNKTLFLGFNEDHDLIEEGDFSYISYTINEYYYETPMYDMYYQTKNYDKACSGDTAVFNGLVYDVPFLTEDNRAMIGITETNQESSFLRSLNYNNQFIYYYKKNSIGKTHIRCRLLVNENGTVNRRALVAFNDERNQGDLNYVYNNPETPIYVKDTRFFEIGDNAVTIRDNVSFEKYIAYYSIDMPLGNTFATNTYDEFNYLSNEVSESHSAAINPIVDYEKVVFEPYIFFGDDITSDESIRNSDNFSSASEIEFNLHFRKRRVDAASGVWELYDETDWENNGWNNYVILRNNRNYTLISATGENGLTDSDADSLYYLGFTDGDVYYQKNRLSKSFLRLSFYDSRDTRTQTLQFYTDLYYDTADAYTKLTKTVANTHNLPSFYSSDFDTTNNSTQYVSDEHINGDINERLCARFSAYDKYKYGKSSNGYYLYMFPDIVSDTTPTRLYMKVEFNHAAYGETITMSMPVDDNDIPIASDSQDFPFNYKAEQDYNGIDMDKLRKDVYIEVWVMYDYNKNKYKWFLPRSMSGNTDGKITFNLFEPIVNPIALHDSKIVGVCETGITVNISYCSTEDPTIGRRGASQVVNIIENGQDNDIQDDNDYDTPSIIHDQDGGGGSKGTTEGKIEKLQTDQREIIGDPNSIFYDPFVGKDDDDHDDDSDEINNIYSDDKIHTKTDLPLVPLGLYGDVKVVGFRLVIDNNTYVSRSIQMRTSGDTTELLNGLSVVTDSFEYEPNNPTPMFTFNLSNEDANGNTSTIGYNIYVKEGNEWKSLLGYQSKIGGSVIVNKTRMRDVEIDLNKYVSDDENGKHLDLKLKTEEWITAKYDPDHPFGPIIKK